MALGLLLPKLNEVNALRQAAVVAHQKYSALKIVGAHLSPQARAIGFYESLPEKALDTNQLAMLINTVREYGIALNRAEYVLSQEDAEDVNRTQKNEAIGRYEITLPMLGTYLNIRQCLIALLNHLPNAAINEISFKRENAQTEQLEARIKITLFLKNSALAGKQL